MHTKALPITHTAQRCATWRKADTRVVVEKRETRKINKRTTLRTQREKHEEKEKKEKIKSLQIKKRKKRWFYNLAKESNTHSP